MENTTPQSLITYLLNLIKNKKTNFEPKCLKGRTNSHENIFAFQLLTPIIYP